MGINYINILADMLFTFFIICLLATVVIVYLVFEERQVEFNYESRCEKQPTSCGYIACMLKRPGYFDPKEKIDLEEKYVALRCINQEV